ncbi:MAG: OmpA family protein [Flavobacteriales bacterium]|nr:OmpA family protein [Flavobacteriales bacterium]
MKRSLILLNMALASLSVAAQETYVVEPLRIAPEAEDYAPVIVDSTLVFCSLRDRDGMVTYRNEETGKPFSDLHQISLRHGADRSPRPVGDALNSDLHDGPATFMDNGRIICFTQNLANRKKLGNTRSNDDRLGLFFSNRIGGGWTVPEPFPFNSDAYSVMHAAIAPDGRRLVFASDMPGGSGGFDLYVSDLVDGEWEIPVNLGPAVNSSANEVFPFIAANNVLYFSSARNGGRGGSDIYMCRPIGPHWGSAKALPEPVNSEANDYAYTSFPSDRSGYFSSDRDGTDRIHSFRRMLPLFKDCKEQQPNNYCYQFKAPSETALSGLPLIPRWDMGDGTVIKGAVAGHCYRGPGVYTVKLDLVDSVSGSVFFTQATYELPIEDIHQAYITSVDSIRSGRRVIMNGVHSNLPGTAIEEYQWDLGDGAFASGPSVEHAWKEPGTYTVRMDVLGVDPTTLMLVDHCVTRTVVVIQRFEDQEDAPVVAQYQDAAGVTRTFEYQALAFDQFEMAIREGEDASFSIELFASTERMSLDDPKFAEVRKLYRVIERYDPERRVYTYSVGESKDLAGLFEVYRKVKELQFLDAEAVVIHPEKLSDLSALALLTEKELDNTVVRESAVYFASGKADIAPAFEPQLGKLVALMQRHPNVDLVIEAHTDAEGSNATNLKLSQLRAQRIMDHLTRNGIAGDRLVPVGHGENHPIADNATEEGRGLNRRVEFRIQVPEEEQAYEKRR